MTFALRFADQRTAPRYPLRVSDDLIWRREGNRLRAEIDLPELASGTILVPSMSADSTASYSFRFSLNIDNTAIALSEVPSKEAHTKGKQQQLDGEPVSTHIDCFHVQQSIPASTLIVETTDLGFAEEYLLCVSARRIDLEDVALPGTTVSAPTPPSLSQMQATDEIKHKICSPTCLAMLLQQFDKPVNWLDFTAACHDEASGLYGVWPMGIWAASRLGCIGAVEVFNDWHLASQVLERGYCFIASIRYSEGSLPGAPLTATSGHLVVVYGIDEKNVYVLDPAAPTQDVVERVYPASEFSNAWLQHRGAAYILLP